MGWTLSHHHPKEPQVIDEFLLALGKALYLATEFEEKCKYILKMLKILEQWEKTQSASETLALVIKDKPLCQTLKEIKGFGDATDEEIALLEQAKNARNYIAHAAGAIGPYWTLSRAEIVTAATKLRIQVQGLAIGDNVISKWIYEFEEKEPAPHSIQRDYVTWVEDWVCGSRARD